MFKTLDQYNDERYHGMFMLRNDGDSADVVIMYRDISDVLVTDAHYIKSDSFSGYVHCNGKSNGCPACLYGSNGIRVQPKLFIPLYVLSSDSVEPGQVLFWDRSVRFQQQLESDVFSKYPNPADFVFRITRNGVAGDVNTTYSIKVVAKNSSMKFDDIMKKENLKFPDFFEAICKTWSNSDYSANLNPVSSQGNVDVESMPEYKISPRVSSSTPEIPDLPELTDLESVPSALPTGTEEPADEDSVNF